MYPVLIGSRALNYWKPSRAISPKTDWDVISYGSHPGCEVHDPEFLNNKDMTGYRSSSTLKLPDGKKAFVMSLLGLSIIKRSHLWRSLSFQKHISDYHKHGLAEVLQESFARQSDIVVKDYYNRLRLTKTAFPQGNPSLKQSKNNFFDDFVTKKYEHDFLHELFAYEAKPLYTTLQDNPEIVWCREDLWRNLTHLQKVQCVAEEVQVIATERFLVPTDWRCPMSLAYTKALDKVCTTLCSGFFRDFAIDNYPEVQGLFHKGRFLEVKSKLDSL